jgi:hypothetical protein
MYLILDIIAVSSFLIITKNRNAFFSCLIKIETFSVAFPAFRLIPAKTVDRFSAVYSASAKSRI